MRRRALQYAHGAKGPREAALISIRNPITSDEFDCEIKIINLRQKTFGAVEATD
jgi:hypothetical protein